MTDFGDLVKTYLHHSYLYELNEDQTPPIMSYNVVIDTTFDIKNKISTRNNLTSSRESFNDFQNYYFLKLKVY